MTNELSEHGTNGSDVFSGQYSSHFFWKKKEKQRTINCFYYYSTIIIRRAPTRMNLDLELNRNVIQSLTFPSNTLVSITMVGTLSSQIIRQKSSTEFSIGPKQINKPVHVYKYTSCSLYRRSLTITSM